MNERFIIQLSKLLQFKLNLHIQLVRFKQFASYIEFGYKKFSDLMIGKTLDLTQQRFNAELKKNPSLKLATWKPTVAADALDFDLLKIEFDKLKEIVNANNMSGVMEVPRNLSDADLVAEVMSRVRNNETIKFGSVVSAAYHICKRPGNDMRTFVADANEIIRTSSTGIVSLTQEGTARNISFADQVFALEVDGRVFLCTFIKKSK